VNFGLTEEQLLLQEQIRRFVADHFSSRTLRRFMEQPSAMRGHSWPTLCDFGIFRTVVIEPDDGLGLRWIDLVVVMEELGRGLCPLPALSQAISTVAIAQYAGARLKKQWLQRLMQGSFIMSPALCDAAHRSGAKTLLRGKKRGGDYMLSGTKRFVPDLTLADGFLVAFTCDDEPEQIRLVAIEASASARAKMQPTVDRTKPTGDLELTDVLVAAENVLTLAPEAFQRLLDYGALLASAEAVGAAEAALSATVQYAKKREQFGSAIGRFQGVKHPLANMYTEVESMKSLVYFAAWTADGDPQAFGKAVSLAKGYCSDAFNRVAIGCVDLHGAMGFTEECDIQLFLKRAKWVRPAFGDSRFHFARNATTVN
jgi:alkylation response protein AidB-like acyl-CoA dehydrogenase